MSATYSNDDVITLTLQKVAYLEGNAPIEAEDHAPMLKMLKSRIEFLRDEGVCFWADGQCPEQCFDPLAEYLTFYVPILPMQERAIYREASVLGLRDLKKMASTSSEGASTRAEYF